MFIFVNSRPVDIKEVSRMLKRIFSDLKIPLGTANAVVSITAPPAAVDVNLEPNKLSVFIEGQEALFEAILEKVRLHFGLDQDQNDSDRPKSPQKLEQQRPDPSAISVTNRVEPILVEVSERNVPNPTSASPSGAPTRPKPPQEDSISPPSLGGCGSGGNERSLSISPGGDASFVEVAWAGQQERTGRAPSAKKQPTISAWATGRAILSERTGVPVTPVAMIAGMDSSKRTEVSAASECKFIYICMYICEVGF